LQCRFFPNQGTISIIFLVLGWIATQLLLATRFSYSGLFILIAVVVFALGTSVLRHEDTVVVVNYWRRRKFKVSEIASMDFRCKEDDERLHIGLRSGEEVEVVALSYPASNKSGWRRKRVQSFVDELRVAAGPTKRDH